MKRLSIAFFFVAFVFMAAFVGAADITNGLSDGILVAGEPPVDGYAIDCHIRVLEFVLGTRMTIAQKQTFMNAMLQEYETMGKEDRNNFLQVVELVDSLSQLSPEDQEMIRQDLEKDFVDGAVELNDDAAAQHFMKLKNESFGLLVDQTDYNVSNQSVEALAEYLAFIAQPEQPLWPDNQALDAIKVRVKAGFASFSDEERNALDDFQLSWYLIRAAWQGTADASKKDAWRKSFAAVGLKSGEAPEVAKIRAALSTDVYADLLDTATSMGIAPLEWSASTSIRVW
ncbi:MAG: hypothetical protein PHD82_04050 [Candidatus Riflebacteria bacterium]|nr:hypothetical protein [Candidatus Riflebacteria bacterium]